MSEEVRRDRQKLWKDGMKKRTAKNERHMDVPSIGENHWVVQVIVT